MFQENDFKVFSVIHAYTYDQYVISERVKRLIETYILMGKRPTAHYYFHFASRTVGVIVNIFFTNKIFSFTFAKKRSRRPVE